MPYKFNAVKVFVGKFPMNQNAPTPRSDTLGSHALPHQLNPVIRERMFKGEMWFPTRFSLAEILVMDGPAGNMAPPASTRISARIKHVQGHGSPANVAPGPATVRELAKSV